MVLGVGTDIIEVSRVREAWLRFGARFMERILRPTEIEYCSRQADPGPFLAVRFSAKEAVSKAFGTGIGAQLGWQDMEIVRLPSGQPTVVLHGEGLRLMEQRGGRHVHVSLSHTAAYATAMAVLES
jgi:holo-[acyl-carrier protein] synthase